MDPTLTAIGTWSGGRKGIYREDPKGFHGLARGKKSEAPAGTFDGYEPLVAAIMKFYQTRVSPVPPKETVGILAFMEAADLSKRRGGAAVKLSEVIKQAETAQR